MFFLNTFIGIDDGRFNPGPDPIDILDIADMEEIERMALDLSSDDSSDSDTEFLSRILETSPTTIEEVEDDAVPGLGHQYYGGYGRCFSCGKNIISFESLFCK